MTQRWRRDELAARALDLLTSGRAGFVSDFDGTLSPIVPRPDQAQPLPAVVEALGVFVRRLRLVAIVTGRQAQDVAERLPVPGIVIVGNHGVEWLENGSRHIAPQAELWIPRISAAAHVLRNALPELLVEEKLITLTVHTREVQSDDVRRQARAIVEQVAREHGLVVKPGKEVWELRPRSRSTRGQRSQHSSRHTGSRRSSSEATT